MTTHRWSRGWDRLRLVILQRDRYVCHYCGEEAGTVDHVVPRAEGGTDEPWNLVAACTTCNSARSSRGSEPAAPRGGQWVPVPVLELEEEVLELEEEVELEYHHHEPTTSARSLTCHDPPGIKSLVRARHTA